MSKTVHAAQERLTRLLLAGADTGEARAELKRRQAAGQARAAVDVADAAAERAEAIGTEATAIVGAAHGRVAKLIEKLSLEG